MMLVKYWMNKHLISVKEITDIIRENGGRKSVLRKHMIGRMRPDSGEIFFYGKPLSNMKRSEINGLWQKFSYVLQDAALFDFMTVHDNIIAFPLLEGTTSIVKLS